MYLYQILQDGGECTYTRYYKEIGVECTYIRYKEIGVECTCIRHKEIGVECIYTQYCKEIRVESGLR